MRNLAPLDGCTCVFEEWIYRGQKVPKSKKIDQNQHALAVKSYCGKYEPSHEIMALFVLRKLNLQMRIRSHPVGLDVCFLVCPFVYFRSSCVRTAKALARLRRWAGSPEPSLVAYVTLCGCAGLPEPSLVAYVISTIISWAGSYMRTAKALARLRGWAGSPKPSLVAFVILCRCAGSPEPSLVAYVISTIISWAGSYMV